MRCPSDVEVTTQLTCSMSHYTFFDFPRTYISRLESSVSASTTSQKIRPTMRLSSLLSFVLLLLAPSIRAAVLAIDYGAEFTKLSLVKPGVPLDVVLDRDSKRKIQSVVGWKRDDRVFGQEGKMAVSGFIRDKGLLV